MSDYSIVKGGVTTPRGFKAAAAAAGIKYPGRNDVALIVSDPPAVAAGMFTTNKVKAAPVRLCRARVGAGRIRAIIVNSGNANACTGPQGDRDCRRTADVVAAALGARPREVLVCSTGTIGIPMPMDRLEKAVPAVVNGLSPKGGAAAARAIMTTDTVDKQVAVRLRVDGRAVTIGAMAKGAGMIEPNMATMLAFVTTDAAVDPAALRACLRDAVNDSLNCISVDGDQSTNDTVLVLANGAAGNRPLGPRHPDWKRFAAALRAVTFNLARRIVLDGEGATKFVTVTVAGARSRADARKAARAIANSLLVKTSWYGCDPNWGRVIAAVGYSGAAVKADRVEIRYDGQIAVEGGRAAAGFDAGRLKAVLRQKEFALRVDLGSGSASHTMLTCDCTDEYVKINGSYMT